MALNPVNILALLAPADIRAIKSYFREWCRQKHKNHFSILITGKTGVGKSSLVNALVGKMVAEEGRKKVNLTTVVTPYCVAVIEDIEDIEVRVYDSPGLQDGTDNEQLYLAEIEGKIEGKLDLVIFCLRMDATRFYPEDKKTMQTLTQAFGKKLWKNAVIALTFANKVEDPAGGDKEAFFLEELENWREEIIPFFRDKLEIDPELLQSLPLVPTGNYRQLDGLPNCENWLSKFWSACYDVARGSAAFNLYRINRARIRFAGSENLASASSGCTEETETQTPSSAASTGIARPSPRGEASQIPGVIALGKEEQDSFWKKTWEMFKKHCLKTSVLLSVISTVGSAGFAILKMFK